MRPKRGPLLFRNKRPEVLGIPHCVEGYTQIPRVVGARRYVSLAYEARAGNHSGLQANRLDGVHLAASAVLVVPPQDVITRDNVTLKVDAVVTHYVVDPNDAAIKVVDYANQTSQFAQTTLRSVLSEVELDELLSHRDKLNLRIQSIIDQRTQPFGVKVISVEVKQVDLPEQMQRAMAKQAEAEREKRAKIIHAQGEFSAAQNLVDAAALMATQPITIQLRYLQTLTEIGVEKNTTIVFPLPVEMLSLFKTLQPLAKADPGKQ